jgi:hypothetical protein
MDDCQSSSDADPLASSSSISFSKAPAASVMRKLFEFDERIEFKKSRRILLACSEGRLRAPCKVSSAAAANWLSVLICPEFELMDRCTAGPLTVETCIPDKRSHGCGPK